MGFKAIFARNLAYLWRATSDPVVKNNIQAAIDRSVMAMVNNSCDVNWNCGGNWVSFILFFDLFLAFINTFTDCNF